MKKAIWSVLLLAALLLAACGEAAQPAGGGATAPTAAPAPAAATAAPAPAAATAAPAPAAKTEVTWYVRTNPVEQEWETKTVIPDFEAKNPDIKINLVIVQWGDFDTKMQTLIAAGNPPDVWSHWGPSGFRDYVMRGLVADLTPYIDKNKFDLTDFNQDVLNIYKVDGKIMGMPMLTTGSYVFYNKDLFDKAGIAYPPTKWDDPTWTWDKFIETAKKLTKDIEDPAKAQWGANLGAWPDDQYVWMFGQDTYPDAAYQTGIPEATNWNTPAAIKAWQAYQDAIFVQKVAPDSASTKALGDNVFESGRVAMHITGGWGLWNYAKLDKFKWGTAALPAGAPGAKPVIFTDPWMLSAKSKHPNEAARFLLYLSSADAQKTFAKVSGAPPVRKSLLADWYKQFPTMKPEELQQVFDQSLKIGRESPNHLVVRFDQVNKVVGTALDPIKNNQKKAADAIPAVAGDLEKALKQIKEDVGK